MNKITRFAGKIITIDGIVGTIHKPIINESGFCEFVWRDDGIDGVDGIINAQRISKNHIRSVGENMFTFNDGYDAGRTMRHYPRCQSWICDFPNGEYISRDESLRQAGI